MKHFPNKTTSRTGAAAALAQAVGSSDLREALRLTTCSGSQKFTRSTLETHLLNASRLSGASRLLRQLVKLGARVSCRNEIGQTPLMIASAAGVRSNVASLVACGAALNATNQDRETALTFAIVWHHAPIVRLLLGLGALPDWPARPWSPIMFAASEGCDAVVRILAKSGARVERRDPYGRTPADIARAAGHQRLAVKIERWAK